MRVLVLYAHPVETSFAAELHRTVVRALTDAGHTVDDCDLYAESFDPVLSRQERLDYLDVHQNQRNVASYVERVLQAEALVLVHPVWNFGFPAILKGFIDRVFLPGVSFRLVDGRVRPSLHNIRKLVAVVTYGGGRWRTLLTGDPPRKVLKRFLRALVRPSATVQYVALYNMDRNSEADRRAFLKRVTSAMRKF